MEKKFAVTAVGEVLIDFLELSQTEKGFPDLRAQPGGAPMNFLLPSCKAGLSTSFLGAVGEDSFGRRLEAYLKNRGIDVSGLSHVSEAFTTLAFVTLDERGDREFSFARKPGADQFYHHGDRQEAVLENSRVVHFGSLSLTTAQSQEETFHSLFCARAAGAKIHFDPNYRAGLWLSPMEAVKRIRQGLAEANAVKIGWDELQLLLPEAKTPQEGARLLWDLAPHLSYFCLTLGAEGSYASCSPEEMIFVSPRLSKHTVDTTGAGDLFGGSVLAWLLKEGIPFHDLHLDQMEAAVRFATVAASLSTERYGGPESCPEWEEVLEEERQTKLEVERIRLSS